MVDQTLHIPLRVPQGKGFYDPEVGPQSVLVYAARLKLEEPYIHLVLERVPAGEADALVDQVRRCLGWAAVRLNHGLITDRGELRRVRDGLFDGQFCTAYPEGA